MTLVEIISRLKNLKDQGFIPSLRGGSTGIGYTLETRLGLSETNISVPDLGGRVELKATRRNSSSLITLFTFNKGVWQIPQKLVVENYGYIDETGRKSLYCTVWSKTQNSQGLSIQIDRNNHQLNLVHNSNNIIATWDIYNLISKLISKLGKVLFVTADSRAGESKIEEFHFNEAYLLIEPTAKSFIKALEDSTVCIDIRMHLKESNHIRNHGTAIRIKESDIPLLFEKKETNLI
ncbi:MAG: MvaI/BcnI family restriction endonuclease [Nitrospirae bacterium YQR-1]